MPAAARRCRCARSPARRSNSSARAKSSTRWKPSIPPASPRRILDMGDVVSLVEKAAETLDKEEAEKLAAKMKKGQFDMNDLARQLQPDEEAGRHEGRARHAARRRQDQGPARRRRPGRQDPHAPGSHHPVDDQAGARRSRCDQRLAPQAHRRGRGRRGQRSQQASENAPPDGGHDEEDGQGRPHADDASAWVAAECPADCRPECFRGRRNDSTVQTKEN